MKYLYYSFFTLIITTSCLKDRVIEQKESTIPLKVNEFVATGSNLINEFGTAEDWIEIYNTSDSDFNLESGKWFLTDDAVNNIQKFEIPQVTIKAKSFLLVFCDGLNSQVNEIHTNFSLSKEGEKIGLFYLDSLQLKEIDRIDFGFQNTINQSNARIPDGYGQWQLTSNPTPGESNK